MDNNLAVSVHNVSKKFCKTLKLSMLYGMHDVLRNAVGKQSHSEKLRKQEFWALDNVSFDVKKGDSIGIIGPNGSGKTTLLKLMNGIFWPDTGKIIIRGNVGALIQVGAGFHPLLTGRENIFLNAAILGMKKKDVEKAFDSIVEFADIGEFLDTPVKFYSSGMFVRLGFAIAVHSKPDILLVDEILAVGDEGFQKKCFNKIASLRDMGTTILLVSHNMHKIATFTNKVIVLNKGNCKTYNNVAEGIEEYSKLFRGPEKTEIEKICSGTEYIRFSNIVMTERELNPGDSFRISMDYELDTEIDEVGIDSAIISNNEGGLYFQATNKAYNETIKLKKGGNSISINFENIQINNAEATIVVAIWKKNKGEYLFWWRIPVTFKGVEFSTGRNHLEVSYEFNNRK